MMRQVAARNSKNYASIPEPRSANVVFTPEQVYRSAQKMHTFLLNPCGSKVHQNRRSRPQNPMNIFARYPEGPEMVASKN